MQKHKQTKHIGQVGVGQRFKLRGMSNILMKQGDGSHVRLNKPISKKVYKRIENEVLKGGLTLEEAIKKHARGYRPDAISTN